MRKTIWFQILYSEDETVDEMDKTVDFILVWLEDYPKKSNDSQRKREIFEKNLINEGLELSYQVLDKFHFVKIYGPTEVLARYCEILKLKMPIKIVSVLWYSLNGLISNFEVV